MNKSKNSSLLTPGQLWEQTVKVSESALACGDLLPIHTTEVSFMEQDIEFVARQVTSLKQKALDTYDRQTFKVKKNPFDPPDPALTIGTIPPHHTVVLNKFRVLNHHLLLITNQFEPQLNLLNFFDFTALAGCMKEFPSLGFYNGGAEAGASQSHKHLQIVPLPIARNQEQLPITHLFPAKAPFFQLVSASRLPFQNQICFFLPGFIAQDETAGRKIESLYQKALKNIGKISSLSSLEQPFPYNLLVTKDWMLVVPRSKEYYQDISVNALGFVGSFFLANDKQMESLNKVGPLKLLKEVSMT